VTACAVTGRLVVLTARRIRRVAELRPSLVVFGHGRPWRDPDALERFAEALPAQGR
jgi:glyoxylase-like metal-dependent hydrolase (beta-lactamase superfamily II)